MLYTDISMPLPKDPRYELHKVKDGPTYVKYREKSYREQGKLKHKRVLIGRLCSAEDDLEDRYFHPNTKYFSYFEKPKPTGGTVSKAGRPPKKTNPIKERPQGERVAFGYTLACHTAAKELHLTELLEQSFGSALSRKIIAAASFLAMGAPGGLSHIDRFSQNHMCFTDCILTSQSLSELYRSVLPDDCNEFFRRWIKLRCADDFVCYDVTSISSFSSTLPMVSYGYNRDKEQLPQINVGMFCTIKQQLPVFFSHYNGSINDFTNLPYVLEQAENAGLDLNAPLTLVMDGGLAVADTLENTRRHGCQFIVGAPMSFCEDIRERVLAWRRMPLSPDQGLILWPEESIRYKVESYEAGRVRTRLMMFKSPKSAATDEENLTSRVNQMAEELRQAKNLGDHKLKRFGQFYDIQKAEHGGYEFRLKERTFREFLELCGCFAIFCTRDDLPPEEVLKIYRAKDCVEKTFAALKNEILEERLEIKRQDSIYGKLFLAFIALILRRSLHTKLRSVLLKSRMGLDSALLRLDEIICCQENDNWFLTSALTKQQKELVKALNLPVHFLELASK